MANGVLAFRAQLVDVLLADEERIVEIFVWSTTIRRDVEGTYDAVVPFPDGGGRAASEVFDVALPMRVESTDARVWFAIATYAASDDGPLAGGRAGSASLTLIEIQEHVERGAIELPLVLEVPGTGRGGVRKATLRIVEFTRETVVWVRQWEIQRTTNARIEEKDARILNESVMLSMYPFSDDAAAHGEGLAPSRDSVEPLHAPVWAANRLVPTFLYWSEVGDHAPARAMAPFLGEVARAALARHGWTEERYVAALDAQFASDEYIEETTEAAALTMAMCALPSTSLYYRYDELYTVSTGVFGICTRRLDIESFADPLLLSGDDCEGTGSLVHRVARWVKMGQPEQRGADRGQYWRQYGGWDDPVLDRAQRLLYWYTSMGCLGSVTSAHIGQADGKAPVLIIDSKEDAELPIGGHMWQEAMPVTKFEDMLARTNKTLQRGALRPHYPGGAYPAWVARLPHTVGEGTGATYPLVLPLEAYAQDKAAARARQQRIADALAVLDGGEILPHLAVERYSSRVADVPDARVNTFYRRTTHVYTDDALLQGIPHAEFVWVHLAPRVPEGTTSIDARGGEHAWTYGVDMRDKILAPPEVGLMAMPALTADEASSFRERARDLRPWRQPRRTPERMEAVKARVTKHLDEFNAALPAQADTGDAVLVVSTFRRDEFTIKEIRDMALKDVRALGDKIVSARAVPEMWDDRLYNVRLEMWVRA
jgi:hypothetical protein